MNTPQRKESESLLKAYIKSDSLQVHSYMVADAMEEYANSLNKSADEVHEWWTAGLLHDLDWEKFPDEHPNKAVKEILPENGYGEDILKAVEAHAPDRTGRIPESEMERYLFACDEISGFMNAVSLMRPNKFSDMKVKSVTKKLKDKRFAESVPREDIKRGAELINKELNNHIQFLIETFKKKTY